MVPFLSTFCCLSISAFCFSNSANFCFSISNLFNLSASTFCLSSTAVDLDLGAAVVVAVRGFVGGLGAVVVVVVDLTVVGTSIVVFVDTGGCVTGVAEAEVDVGAGFVDTAWLVGVEVGIVCCEVDVVVGFVVVAAGCFGVGLVGVVGLVESFLVSRLVTGGVSLMVRGCLVGVVLCCVLEVGCVCCVSVVGCVEICDTEVVSSCTGADAVMGMSSGGAPAASAITALVVLGMVAAGVL